MARVRKNIGGREIKGNMRDPCAFRIVQVVKWYRNLKLHVLMHISKAGKPE